MAILFRLLDGDVEVEPPQRGPELSEALQHYLWPLSRSGQFTANLAVLRGLDPYDDATFTGAQLAALEDVTRQFRDELTVTPKEISSTNAFVLRRTEGCAGADVEGAHPAVPGRADHSSVVSA